MLDRRCSMSRELRSDSERMETDISTSKRVMILRSFGSAAYLFAARALTVIYQLRFAEHAFGPSYGGLIVLLNQITFYILMAELGLAAATTSLLFEPIHSGDTGRARALIAALRINVRRIAYWIAPLSLIAVCGLSFYLRRQVPLTVLVPSLLLTCASALLTFLALPYQSLFNATDRVPTRNLVLGSGFAGKVLVGILLARAMHSFVGLALGTTLVGVVELLVQRGLMMPHLGTGVVGAEMLATAQGLIRGRAKFVLFHRIGYLFAYQSDYIILLLSSSLSLLGYYAQYQYIYAGLLSFSFAVGGTLTARIARRQLTIGKPGFAAFYRRTSLLAAAAAAVCGLGFYFFTQPAIRILYHTDHVDSRVVLLFAVMLMLNILKMNDDVWIDTTGAYSTGYLLPIFEACTYVGLGLMLVRHYQMTGVLYAGILTNVLFSVAFKSFVLGRGVMEREVRSTVITKLINLAGVAAVLCSCIFLVHFVHGLRLFTSTGVAK